MTDLYDLALRVTAQPAVDELGRFESAATSAGASGATAGQKFSTGFNAAAQSGARTAATTFATQFGAQYDADKARIQEALVRGLLTPEQARQAGRDAAAQYNAGLLSQLDRLGASGLGADNSPAYRGIADSLKPVETAADSASLGLGRLRYTMTSLVDTASGVPPIIGRVVSSFGGITLGLAPLLELLAAIAAMAEAWKYVQGPANDASKAIESNSDSARDAYRDLTALNAAMLGLNAVRLGEPTAELTKFHDEAKKLTDDLGGDNSLRTFANTVRDLFRDSATSDGSVQFQLTVGHLNELYKTGHLSLQQYTQDVIDLVKQNPAVADLAAQYLKQAGALQGVVDKMGELKAVYEQQVAQQNELSRLYGDASLAKLGEQAHELDEQYRALASGGQDALNTITKSQSATREATAAWHEYVTAGNGITKTFQGITLAHYTYADAVKLGIPAVAQFKIATDAETAAALRQEAALKAVSIARTESASTGQNAASIQAAENEYNLLAATNANKLADQEAADAAAHRWATIAIGSKTEQDLVAATAAASAADIAATAATRDREVAVAQLKTTQDAQAQVEAAGIALRTALIGATAQEAAAARARYSDTINAIDAQHSWRDAQTESTDATIRQSDADTRAANNTAFTDALAATVDHLKAETATLYLEVAAKQQGQAATDALAVTLAGEAAVRALVNDAAQKHVAITQAEIDATRQAAEAHEKAALALQHVSQEDKEFANVSKNFVRTLQSDAGTFFTNLFDGGTSAATKFWDSFRDLALKTFGELASKDLIQSVISGTHGQGAFSFLGGFGGASTSAAPSAANYGVNSATGISDFTGVGVGNASSFNLGTFSLAAAGVVGVANALNSLIGAAAPTKEGIEQLVNNIIALDKSIASYQASVSGNSVAGAIASNQNTADQLRAQIEKDLGGTRLQGARETRLGEVDTAQAQGYQQIAQTFFDGIRSSYNATLGPAGAYQNSLDAAAEKYIADTQAAKTLGAGQEELDSITATYTNTVDQLTAAYKENLAQVQYTLDARQAAANGDSAIADQTARRAAEEKELFDDTQAGYTDAQLAQVKYIQGLEDEAAAKAKLTQATESLATNLAAGPSGTLGQQQAAALQPLIDQYAADLKNYNDAVTAGLDPMTQLALQVQVAADAAAIAAQTFNDAVSALNQSTSDIESAVSGGNLSGSAGLGQERFNIGNFAGVAPSNLTDDLIHSLYTIPQQGQELTAYQRELNKQIDQYFKDEQQWGTATAANTGALADAISGSGGSASLQTSAIATAAGGLTELTGNRMADYLASANVHLIEIRDDARARYGISPLGGAFSGPTTNPFGTTPTFPPSGPSLDVAGLRSSIDALSASIVARPGSGGAGTIKIDVTVRGDDPFAVQRIVQQLRPALDKAVNEDLGKLFINVERSQGVNTVGSSRSLVGG